MTAGLAPKRRSEWPVAGVAQDAWLFRAKGALGPEMEFPS